MELFGIADSSRNFLTENVEQWKLLLTSNGKDLWEVDLKGDIFQGDSLGENSLNFYVTQFLGKLHTII